MNHTLIVPATCALLLGACGQSNEDLADEAAMAAEAAMDGASMQGDYTDPDASGLGLDDVDMGTADLEQLDCPTIMKGSPKTADIVGVTVGMSAQTAYQRIACSNPALTVNYSVEGGFKLPKLPDGTTPLKMITANGGQEEFTVWLIGKPGEERVIALRRKLTFGSGEEPPTETLVTQIQEKYGTLTVNRYNGNEGGVVKTADNRLLTDNTNRLFSRCLPDDYRSISINEACGLSVGVAFEAKNDNDALVDKLTVTITHGKYGQRLITAFRDYAANAVAAQKQAELKAAQDRAAQDAPAL